MAERDPPGAEIPHALPASRRHRYLSLVWLVPMVAAAVAGWFVVQAVLRQGPTVKISFLTAEGVQPGITRLRYKDVEIGTVSAVTLSDDRTRVIVTARMQQQAEPLLREDTRFWVVRPRVSASSVSGLGTLFSGAYIGVDAGSAPATRRDYVGLEVPPVVIGGRTGTQFLLRSETIGSLDIGSPVYFRQVQVGQVVGFEIDRDGGGTTSSIFVNAPYDRFVKPGTRFWLASGIDARFDASGFQLNTESLVSILVGGIAFRTPTEDAGNAPAAAKTAFRLFPDQASALREPDAVVLPALIVFRESVRGLAPGAPIEFRGIPIGEVRSVDLAYDHARQRAEIEVRADLYPERLLGRRSVPAPTVDGTAVLERLLQRGLGAQLRQANLLTGQLYVALDFVAAGGDRAARRTDGRLSIPASPGTFTELQTTVAAIARKLERLPLEELAVDARRTLGNVERTLAGIERLARDTERTLLPQSVEAIQALRESLARTQELLDTEAPTQTQLRATLRDVARAADAVRLLAELLERQPEALLRGRGERR